MFAEVEHIIERKQTTTVKRQGAIEMADKKSEKFNQKLSVEELDEVAGGTYIESANDAAAFKELGINVYTRTVKDVPVLLKKELKNLSAAFEQCGVTFESHDALDTANKYFIGGKEVSREKAWSHVKSQLGK